MVEITSWHGRELIDPHGATIGTIAASFVDRQTGTPEWLGVTTDEHPGELTIVPVTGAGQAGRAVAVPHETASVRDAPRIAAREGAELEVDQERVLAQHFGLVYDTEHSATGVLVERQRLEHDRRQPAGARSPSRPEGPAREALLDALAGAHALEASVVAQLSTLAKDFPDDAVGHDLANHLRESEGHQAAVAARLAELEIPTSSARDAMAKVGAKLKGGADKVRGDAALDVRDTYAIKHLEIAVYTTIERLADRAGDPRTAQLARHVRADEDAMAFGVAAAWNRLAELTSRDVVALLHEARAIEQGVLTSLEDMVRTAGEDGLRRTLERHREETRAHLDAVDARLQALGAGSPAPGTVAATAGALLKAAADTMRGQGPLRVARDAFAAEALEIATYELLERVALHSGDQETASLAAAIRADERAMAAELGGSWDAVVGAAVGAS